MREKLSGDHMFGLETTICIMASGWKILGFYKVEFNIFCKLSGYVQFQVTT